MKNFLGWIKGNPITVASIVVVLLALGFLVWVQMQGSGLQQRMQARSGQVNSIKGLMNKTVQIPSETPDNPPDSISGITINPIAIEQLEKLKTRMNEEYDGIFKQAVAVNRAGHALLADGLFPSTEDPALPYAAKDTYLAAFDEMLEPYPDDVTATTVLPRLDAAPPPTADEIAQAVAKVEADFMSSLATTGVTQLTQEDQNQLFQEKRQKALEVMRERAESIHVYADNDMNSPTYPFHIAPWSQTNDRPEDFQLWEGQLELWVQEDIVRAIAMTNNVADPSVSVLDAPIKRLKKITVVPGYVGLHTRGGVVGVENPTRANGSYPAPAGGKMDATAANRRLSDNFYVSPSGRVSNALYDVRHAIVEMIVDYQRLPAFFNSLSQVNFMTVLECDIKDVDEYAALQEAYMYGPQDVVEVRLVIETIWLRDWTSQYMPKLTRQYVGLDDPVDLDPTPAGGAPGMPFDYGGGYDYGGMPGYYGPPPGYGGPPPGYAPPQ